MYRAVYLSVVCLAAIIPVTHTRPSTSRGSIYDATACFFGNSPAYNIRLALRLDIGVTMAYEPTETLGSTPIRPMNTPREPSSSVELSTIYQEPISARSRGDAISNEEFPYPSPIPEICQNSHQNNAGNAPSRGIYITSSLILNGYNDR